MHLLWQDCLLQSLQPVNHSTFYNNIRYRIAIKHHWIKHAIKDVIEMWDKRAPISVILQHDIKCRGVQCTFDDNSVSVSGWQWQPQLSCSIIIIWLSVGSYYIQTLTDDNHNCKTDIQCLCEWSFQPLTDDTHRTTSRNSANVVGFRQGRHLRWGGGSSPPGWAARGIAENKALAARWYLFWLQKRTYLYTSNLFARDDASALTPTRPAPRSIAAFCVMDSSCSLTFGPGFLLMGVPASLTPENHARRRIFA